MAAQTDLTIDDILSDPMILALRTADRVDATGFEVMLRAAAREQRVADAMPRPGAAAALFGLGRRAQASFGMCRAW